MLSIDNQNKSNFRKKKLKTVKNMYLVRKKHTNKDKENNWVETFEQALALIGPTKENIKQSVSWLNYIDSFFAMSFLLFFFIFFFFFFFVCFTTN